MTPSRRLTRCAARPFVFAMAVGLLAAVFAASPPARAQADGGSNAEAEGPQTIDLRPIWEDGQTSRYRSVTRRKVHQVRKVMGNESEQSQLLVFEAEAAWKVIDAREEGGGEVELKMDKLEMRMTGSDGKTYKASARRADDALKRAQQLLKGLTSRPIRFVVASDGTIERVRDWKAVAAAAGEAGESLTESDFREIAIELALLPGAVADAKRGSTWREDFQWSHEMGELDLDTTYKVVAFERVAGVPIANIQAISEIDAEIDKSKFQPPGGNNAQGPKVDVKFNGGKQGAQIMYDLSRNEIVGHNVTRQLEFQMDLSYQGRKFEQVMTHTMNTQVVRLDED